MTTLAVAVSGRGVVAPETPVLRADDVGFARGQAAFTTMRVYGGRPFRLAEHVTRLRQSAGRIGLPLPEESALRELAELAVAAADRPDCSLRLTWTPGPPGGPPLALAVAGEIPAWMDELRSVGARLVSLLMPRRSEPWLLEGTKSTSYAVNMAAETEAKRRGADDAVFVDTNQVVLEGPVTNIWWRLGSVLYTPSLDLGILAGETRATLIELAATAGYHVEEGVFPLGTLLQAEEVFTSSSVREVMPVVSVDGAQFARGPAAAVLQTALRALATAG